MKEEQLSKNSKFSFLKQEKFQRNRGSPDGFRVQAEGRGDGRSRGAQHLQQRRGQLPFQGIFSFEIKRFSIWDCLQQSLSLLILYCFIFNTFAFGGNLEQFTSIPLKIWLKIALDPTFWFKQRIFYFSTMKVKWT